MGLWYVITWMVRSKKVEIHEPALAQWLQRMKEIFPNQRYRYFNARFCGPRKHVLVIMNLDNVADFEEFIGCLRNDERWCRLVRTWETCIDDRSIQPHYWEERDELFDEV